MGLFNKSINHSKSSKNIDKKIKNLDEEMKKTGVTIDGSDATFLTEKKEEDEKSNWKEESLYNWRESFIVEEIDESQNNIEKTEYKTVKKVESYISESNKELIKIREQIFQEITESTLLNLPEIKVKIEKVLEIYNQIQEGLLNQPPEIKNQDPLTPLNQNFVTVEELNKHYALFINRIQEQIATIGGGGETRLKFLDDIVGIATNAPAYDDKYLKYNHSLGKFEFVSIVGFATSGALTGYATTGYVTNALTGYATTGSIVGFITSGALTGYTTTGYVTNALSGYATTGYVTNALSGYATTGYVTNALSGYATTGSIVGFITSGTLTGYATTGYVTNALSGYATTGSIVGFITSGALSGYATTGSIVGFITSGALSGYATTGSIVGFITSGALSGYATTGYVTNALSGYATTEYVTNALSGYATTGSIVGFITSGALTGYATTGSIVGFITSGALTGYATTGSIVGFITSGALTGYATTSYVNSLTLDQLSDVNVGAPSTGQVLKWSGSQWLASTDLTAAGGTGIGLSDLSVTINTAGINSLTYNNNTGVFLFTPTSLVGYATTSSIVGFITSGALSGYATTGSIVGFITSGALSGYATTGSIVGFITSGALSGYATTGSIVGFITSGALSGYATTGSIVGFITSGALSGYATTGYVTTQLDLNTFWINTSAGIHTLSNVGVGTTNPTSTLTVVGSGTSTSQLFVSGVSTFAGITTVTGPTLFAKQLNVSGVSTFVGDGTNVYQYFTSNNTYLDFASTFNVRKGSIIYIGVSGNTAYLSENTTLNGAYYRIRTLQTGAEVNGDLELNNNSSLKVGTGGTIFTTTYGGLVGVGTANPTAKFEVFGHTKLETLNVSGVSTFAGITTVTGTTLFAKQLNVSGVSTFSNTVNFNTNTVNFGSQCSISTSGNDLSINAYNSVFITGQGYNNGGTYLLSQSGATLLFADSINGNVSLWKQVGAGSAAGQKRLETLGTGVTVTGTTFTNDLSVSGTSTLAGLTTVTGPTLFAKQLNVSGVVTATSFVGDGSLLTGIVASGSGVIVRDSGTVVGTAGTIDFGDNLTVSAVSAGVVTVTGAAAAGSSQFVTTSAGIHTLSNVGIGTTNPTSKVHVVGDAKFTGVVTATSFISENSSGTPKIESPNNLNLNAVTVAISTDVTIGGQVTSNIIVGTGKSVGIGTTLPTSALTVVGSGTSTSQLFVTGVSTFAGITTVTGPTLFAKQISNSGIVTATSFRTNTTVGDGTDVGFAIKYYITSSGASAYRFAGPGVLNSTNNPTLYLHRGFTYIFENSTGGSHPFAIRTSSGGSAYTSAFLSGSQSGTQIFTVPFDAPNTLVYQCTIHSGMVGTLNIVT